MSYNLRIDGGGCEEPGVAGGISINVWLLPRMHNPWMHMGGGPGTGARSGWKGSVGKKGHM